ncbi:MAG TPA: hypothetical protein DCZ84_02690 [Candidatus Vogelbacteria bacterium]|uniref:Uncharacterized protein n=1 Tax=Candidatus Vogelbacteria bacterium RIFOXYD1_FULL_51_18 TaxID=1802440 RepID=A0A1G2QIG0_9BACT|nr:MAG: hypothetical protein UY66_C0022G0002 [Parcubacteria group bacterium GW2011_GWC1_51_35]KKW23965.1 MAG: hypothetical protein UY68_C0016G0012 [Parcubacteria group bacterium GW2011_GWF2_52_12]KKW34164.1 MAG: hypothetical protein UY80_C0024G0011 [Parcubacteria group bacterium GW2011_GWB1_53_43]OHA60386.1 MAG: hypothetical protein A2569_03015 [Candidatus Vogelbacteria bacterium RIFOXYD1_FULL_51_18]HBB65514.1 hypothetical protein [Candidatus Vogelbacteria bacterium]
MTDIPKQATEPSDEIDKLSQIAQELPQDTEAPEAIPYVISFAKYNERMCEISELGGNKAKRAIETLKTIGTKIRPEADFQRNYVDRIPMRYDSEYKKLYRGIAEGIELKEIKLQQRARIFYFDIEPERTFYVVAITENHLETDKVRR